MNSKIMPYALPLASMIFLGVFVVFARPQLTGYFIAQPALNAEIRISADEILPENALIHIFLEKDNAIAKEISVFSIKEFVNKSPVRGLEYKSGKNSQLDYKGYGYVGSHVFNLRFNTDDLNGVYILKTKISYEGKVISETQQEIEI